MSVRADLHIHTTASDGTWTPAELIAEAQKQQLGLIAVTDHDSVANVAEAMTLAAAAGITLLPAAEICSTKEDLSFHILGYGIDIHNKQLLELMQHNEALLEQKDVDSIHLLARDGWPVDEAEFARYTYDRHRGGWRALAYLIDKGLCTGVSDFFQRIFTPEHDLGFPEFPAISEVITAIHAAGGAALCAHAASGFHGPGLERVLDILRRNSTALNATTPTIRKKEHSACCSIAKSTVCLSAVAATAMVHLCRGDVWDSLWSLPICCAWTAFCRRM